MPLARFNLLAKLRPPQRRLARHALATAVIATGLAGNTFAVPPSGEPADRARTCQFSPGTTHTVTKVVDGETVVLDDASEVRLTGALAPRARDSAAAPGQWPPERDSIAALSALVLGKTAELANEAPNRDRYGRRLAELFIVSSDGKLWVQGSLVAQGFARAYALPGAGQCLGDLVKLEQAAREKNLGLWASLPYRPILAGETRLLMSLRSSFQIVRGSVTAVSRTRGAIYINFGEDWKTDFSIRIPQRVADTDSGWNRRLDGLKGQTVEVRGWIERRNGPAIVISNIAEITLPEDNSHPEPPSGDGDTSANPAGLPGPVNGPPATTAPGGKEKRPEPRAPGAFDL